MVAKNPSYHPGDIRVLRCVNIPQLRHLVDCLVFPTQGKYEEDNLNLIEQIEKKKSSQIQVQRKHDNCITFITRQGDFLETSNTPLICYD